MLNMQLQSDLNRAGVLRTIAIIFKLSKSCFFTALPCCLFLGLFRAMTAYNINFMDLFVPPLQTTFSIKIFASNLIINFLLYTFFSALVYKYIDNSLNKKNLPKFELFISVLRKLYKIITANLLFTLLFLVTLLLFILPGLWYAVVFMPLIPLVVIQDMPIIKAIKMSRILTKKYYFRTLFTMLPIFIGSFAIIFLTFFIQKSEFTFLTKWLNTADIECLQFVIIAIINAIFFVFTFTTILVCLYYLQFKHDSINIKP